ncbi:VanW family protein [Guptibacillus algicola]|uniref:VanW family protein n=1 Tax=Guptibacillus algicola TaxID=225844 RepID=UPI001CD2AF38|nr:VanW family protein [Alkalihalobacillus algicola]MCA0986227.1 VanW family protein [Alkalihalobacillus algicola]
MSSETKKGLLKTAGLIVFSTLFISSFSLIGSYTYDAAFGEETLPPNALIGSVSVSGLEPQEANAKLTQLTDEWKASQSLSFSYNEQTVPLSGELWEFQIEQTVKEVAETKSSEVPLYVSVNQELLKEKMGELDVNPSNFSLELLSEVLIGYASTLEKDTIAIDLSNYYSINSDVEEIFQSEVKGTSELILVPSLVDEIGAVTIKPEENFSLQQVLAAAGVTDKATDSLNMFASAIYEIILHTNFEVLERHTTLNTPSYGEPGLNAAVNVSNRDLVFYNPNPTTYKLMFEWQTDTLVATLNGPAFPLQFRPKVEEEVLSPDTIVQYSASLSGNNKTIVEEGEDGLLIKTYRETLDQDDRVIKTEKLLEDFYPPVHRVENRAYPEPTASDGGDSSNSGSGENGEGSENGESTTDDENGGSNSDSEGNSNSGSSNDSEGKEEKDGEEDGEIIKGLEYKREGD